MIEMDLEESVNIVLDFVPEQRTFAMFSATMLPEVSRLAKMYLSP